MIWSFRLQVAPGGVELRPRRSQEVKGSPELQNGGLRALEEAWMSTFSAPGLDAHGSRPRKSPKPIIILREAVVPKPCPEGTAAARSSPETTKGRPRGQEVPRTGLERPQA